MVDTRGKPDPHDPNFLNPTQAAVNFMRNRYERGHVTSDAVEPTGRMKADFDGIVRMTIHADHSVFYQWIPKGISRRHARILMRETLVRIAIRRGIPRRTVHLDDLTPSSLAGATSVPMTF